MMSAMENTLRSNIVILLVLLVTGGALSKKEFLILTEEPEDTVFNTDSNKAFATFQCQADGYPTPDITWLANDQIVTENDLYNVTVEGSLRISAPTRNLNGTTYRCIANNSFGAVMSKAAILEIAYVEDFFNSQLPAIQINANLGRCISCNPPHAYPGIKADWLKDSNSVQPNERIRVMIDGRLCFSYCEDDDTAEYRCVVSNRYYEGGANMFRRSSSFRFTVLPKGSEPSQSLTPVSDLQESVTVRQGQEAVLECFFLGRPAPTITWSKVGNDLPRTWTTHDNDQELRIPNAQPEDSGEYQCTGNSNGDTSTVSRRLTVLAPPSFGSGLKDKEVESGSTVTLQCTTDSDDVEFSWYHNTHWITSSMQRPQISDNNTLIIENFENEDTGIYQCAARNEHGMTLSTAQLSLKEDEPTEGTAIEPELPVDHPSNSETQGSGAGNKFVHASSAVVMASAVLFEVILFSFYA